MTADAETAETATIAGTTEDQKEDAMTGVTTPEIGGMTEGGRGQATLTDEGVMSLSGTERVSEGATATGETKIIGEGIEERTAETNATTGARTGTETRGAEGTTSEPETMTEPDATDGGTRAGYGTENDTPERIAAARTGDKPAPDSSRRN